MSKAEEIYHRFVQYEWNEIGEGMKKSILDAINEALHIADVSCHFTKFKNYGTATDGSIFYIDEEKLNQDHINQIRNYLNSKEKLLKARKQMPYNVLL